MCFTLKGRSALKCRDLGLLTVPSEILERPNLRPDRPQGRLGTKSVGPALLGSTTQQVLKRAGFHVLTVGGTAISD